MNVNRRHFLSMTAAASLGFKGLGTLFAGNGNASPDSNRIAEGFGPMKRDRNGLFDLPEGFSYKIIARHGDPMDDGLIVPGKPDGMAAFPGPDGKTVLICNHENDTSSPEQSPFGKNNQLFEKLAPASCYDPGKGVEPCTGGTTTLLFDTRTGEKELQFLSLAGTLRNCAGGPTPWNTWISCEETVQRAEGNLERDHGFCFEVPAFVNKRPVPPVAIEGMGRFNHEAIAVDYRSGAVYLTEDRDDGLLYRYLPNRNRQLAAGGRLQALAAKERPSLDTRNWDASLDVEIGAELPVEWIDLDNILAPDDDLRHRGFENGAARFARGEGMWAGNQMIYFACTSGGRAKKGQIWKYIPSPFEGTPNERSEPGRLILFVEPNDGGLVDNADNLTVAPWGDLIVCEDGSGEQYLVGITPDGGIYKFAHNAHSDSELAGATFSPDGSTLFVNIQHDGLTLAVTGPWEKARRA